MATKRIRDLGPDVERELERAARQHGVTLDASDVVEVSPGQKPQTLSVSFRGVSVELPAPSQEALDGFWERHAGTIIGAVIALAGVALGATLGSAARGKR